MTKRWTVLRSDELVTLEVAWSDGGCVATRADIAALFGDYGGRAILLEVCKLFGPVEGYRTTTEELVSRTVAALERGDLRLERRRLELPASARVVEAEPERRAERAAPVEEKTWIGIRLVDDADPPKPVAYRSYRLELPDGSTREGMLDAEGTARITGIDPGQCKVTFPGLDPNGWARL